MEGERKEGEEVMKEKEQKKTRRRGTERGLQKEKNMDKEGRGREHRDDRK